MANERNERIKKLLDQAADIEPAQRSAFLDRHCGDDATLRSEVESLLEYDHSGILDHPAFDGQPLAATHGIPTIHVPASQQSSHLGAGVPARIGPYEIVGVVGEGGMGTVYHARQDNPGRSVALKVIKPGLGHANLLKRFRREAEVLGQLRHPGIAHIYEAGAAETITSGHRTVTQPFIVMEYIDGPPLTQYADVHNLNVRQRLELVAKVCDGVQHAHQKGVIHRDLKPANILVAEDEAARQSYVAEEYPSAVRDRSSSSAVSQPKIVDFGVARLIDADVRATMHTAAGQLIGTLAYMSPEQVTGRGSESELDTRSDVYSLGVVLYEVLTGQLPHDLSDVSIPDAARLIRENRPRRLTALDKTLGRDIETIVSKAMDKDKARRYQSASELAADIRRYLHGDPILARGDSMVYVLRKTLSRYRGLATATALLGVTLTVFGIVSFNLAVREGKAKRQAIAALQTGNIERGRLLGRIGSIATAENLIWREHLRRPDSYHTYWALWELYSQAPCMATVAGTEVQVHDTTFSPDGKLLAAAGDSGRIEIRDAWFLEHLATLRGHDGAARAVSFSGDGRRLASCGGDGTIALWDVGSWQRLLTIDAHQGGCHSVSFSPGSSARLASGGFDRTVRLWDAKSGTPMGSAEVPDRQIWRVGFNPDGTILASSGTDAVIRLWSASDLAPVVSFAGHEGAVVSLAFSADGRTLVSGGVDRLIKFWDIESGACVDTLSVPNGTVRSLLFTPNDETLVSVGWRTIDLWDPVSRSKRRSLSLRLGGEGLSCSSDGRRIALAGQAAQVWDISAEGGVHYLGAHSGRVVAAISADGTIIASGDSAGHVRVWEAGTGRRLAEFAGHAERIRALKFNPDSSSLAQLATAGGDGHVRLWDVASGRCVHTFNDHSSVSMGSIAFSPDGHTIALTRHEEGVGFQIELRDVDSGRMLRRFGSNDREIIGVVFSPDGRTMASSARDLVIRVWTVLGEPLAELTDPVPTSWWSLDFSLDGRELISGTWRRDMRIWDLADAEVQVQLEGHSSVIYSVDYHPIDPRLVASASQDGSVRLWDLEGRRSLCTLVPFDGFDVISLEFSPNGKTLVVAGAHESVAVYDLTYYDRHIAGQMEYQIQSLRSELGDEIQSKRLNAWREGVLRRVRQGS